MPTHQQVREFMIAMDQGHYLDSDDTRGVVLGTKLISEEFKEVVEAAFLFVNGVPSKAIKGAQVHPTYLKENFVKELCDLKYVADWMLNVLKVDPDAAFNRVHTSNMSKLGDDGKPVKNEDGKVIKGPNYQPVQLGDLCK